jgi:uncharacterized UBP type Zn finger protein
LEYPNLSAFSIAKPTISTVDDDLKVLLAWCFTRKREMNNSTCTHIAQIQSVTPSAQGCEECLAMGDFWVHLRECLICGHVGCCDSSKNQHATKHFQATGHPIVRSFEPGEDWRWCYIDRTYI